MPGRAGHVPLGRILMWTLLGMAVLPLALAAAAPSPEAPAPRALEGGAVYQATCAVCHGTEGEGGTGTGDTAGPPLRGLPAAYVDLTVRTGRMPLPIEPFTVPDPRLSEEQRQALMEWAPEALSLSGGIPEVALGDPVAGRVLYARHCSACHGPTGGGGIAGGDTQVPGIDSVDALAVVEALRVGPFEMPEFSEQVISDDEAEHVAAYVVEELRSPAGTTPAGLAEIGSVTAAALAAVVVVVLLALVVLVARLAGARSEE